MSIQWDFKKSHANTSLMLLFLEFLSGIKKSYQKKNQNKTKERETSGLTSTTSYLTVTGPSLTTQNFCITEALLDAANSVNSSA